MCVLFFSGERGCVHQGKMLTEGKVWGRKYGYPMQVYKPLLVFFSIFAESIPKR